MIDRVRAGIKLLDEKVPGWRNRINVHTLDIKRSDNCVLGQVFGSYHAGLTVLGISCVQSIDFGFNIPELAYQYFDIDKVRMEAMELTELWKKTLTN